MAKLSVFYSEHPEDFHPVPDKLNISFGPGNIAWHKNFLYIPLEAPFRPKAAEDYADDSIGVSIHFEDLTKHPERPNQFGIDIHSVVRRLEKLKYQEGLHFEYSDIEQFIIQMADIEEIMQMDVKPFYEWR
ncbi:hypothetical protein AB4114_29590 [Paenibacillus sp. 2RAB27]|uniref:hypothetical protein n=1 Tax=Paenibacillus sp. 2RAB27 TaxID=3232991 RepID=UPI003F9B3654